MPCMFALVQVLVFGFVLTSPLSADVLPSLSAPSNSVFAPRPSLNHHLRHIPRNQFRTAFFQVDTYIDRTQFRDVSMQ